MASQDIPGFDEDPELEDLLSKSPEDLDQDTLEDVQQYKSQKLKAKRDADQSTDRPGWWPEGAQAPERLSEVPYEGGGVPDVDRSESGEEDGSGEPSAEQAEDESEQAEEVEETADEEPEEEETGEKPSDEEAADEPDETVEVDLEETDFEVDPEMEELLDTDVFELDQETREEVQLYKSRKMQAKRDARREAGGGGADEDEAGPSGESREDEEGLSKKAPPPSDTGRYEGERKIKDLVSSRDTGREVSRRGFISSLGLGWLGTVAAFSTGAAGAARYFFPNVLSNPPEKFIAGEPSDYNAGQVSTIYKDKYRVWITNLGDRIVAISAICTHLGCTPNWIDSQGVFKCPCHGSAYYQNGVNFAGPAPRPMDRVAVRLNPQGKIVVDKSKQFSSQASPGWEAEEAYIPV